MPSTGWDCDRPEDIAPVLLTDPDAPQAIAHLLGASVERAPFQVPRLPEGRQGQPPTEQGPVYQMSLHSQELAQPLLILLWPSLSRVDVRLGDSSWTLKDISDVELYPSVEVLFRRNDPPAFLFVSVRGRVALVT